MVRNFTLLLILTCSMVNAQPQVLWHSTFGSTWGDKCREVIQTADGGYALCGYIDFHDAPNHDFYFVRTDENGDSLWSRNYGGDAHDHCSAILQTEEGDFLLAGYTDSYGAGSSDGWIIKTDPDGEVVWSQTYGWNSGELFMSIIPITDDRYALVGIGGDWNFYFVIINEDGEELFVEQYGGEGADNGRSLLQVEDGGFLLAGSSTSFGAGGYDMYLIKTDNEGEVEWTQTYGGEANDYCQLIIRTIDSGYALAGGTRSYGAGEVDFYLVKIDENGEEQWSQTYGRRYDDQCFSLLQLENGDFVLAGYSYRPMEGNSDDFYIIRVDSCGEIIWEQNMNSGRNVSEECYSMIQTADGGYALAGKRGDDFWLVKLGTDMIRWLSLPDSGFIEDSSLIYDIEYFYDNFFPSVYQDSVLVFTVDDGEHVFGEFEDERLIITAEEDWFGVDSLMLTIAEADSEENCDTTWLRLTVTENTSTPILDKLQIPTAFFLSNAFPNPFNSTTSIVYSLPAPERVTVKIFDLSGRGIATLVDGRLEAGNHHVYWNGLNTPSGVYICRMEAGSFTKSIKVALVR